MRLCWRAVGDHAKSACSVVTANLNVYRMKRTACRLCLRMRRCVALSDQTISASRVCSNSKSILQWGSSAVDMARLQTLCALFLIIGTVQHSSAEDTTAYSSLIRPLVRSLYWQVENQACTSSHAINLTNGDVVWKRSPVGFDQAWGTKVTDKRVFYTLSAGGPATYAVSLDSGKTKWAFPNRKGFAFFRKWDIDLPQDAQLADPLPVAGAEVVIVHSANPGSKVYALNMTNGLKVWEWDASTATAAAAAAAGLPGPGTGDKPLQVDVTDVSLNLPDTLYVVTSMSVPASDGPMRASGAASSTASPAVAGAAQSQIERRHKKKKGDKEEDVDDTVGWVWALDVRSGQVAWGTGPLANGVASVVVAERQLLLSSHPDVDGTGTLMGVNKATGAVLYTMSCTVGPCMVGVADTRLALMLGSLAKAPLSLAGLAAFDMHTGEVVWQGVPDAQLQPVANGSCSAAAFPRQDIHVTCTCAPPVAPPAVGDTEGVLGREGGRTKGPGLCAFSIAVESGKLRYEMVLSSVDAVPPGANAFGLQPLILADSVIYPGQRGVYAVSTAAVAPPTLNSLHNILQAPQHGMTGGATHAQASAGGTLSVSAPATPMFSFPLPAGLAFKAWDWMDLKEGLLIIRTSPDIATPLPDGVQQCSKQAVTGTSAPSDEGDEKGGEHLSQRVRAFTAAASMLGATGSISAAGGLAASLAMSSAHQAGDGQGSTLQRRPRPRRKGYTETRLFALDPNTGKIKWQQAFNASIGPLHVTPSRHEWGRGGLLLVDGCRPPLSDTPDPPTPPVHGNRLGSRRQRHLLQDEPNDGVNEAGGDETLQGTACCIYALSVTTGALEWRHCFDLDRACGAGLARDTATTIVYALLVLQVVLLIVGFSSTAIWRFCCKQRYLLPVNAYTEAPVLEVLAHDVASEESDGE